MAADTASPPEPDARTRVTSDVVHVVGFDPAEVRPWKFHNRAESGMDDIEDEIEDDDSLDADLEEIRVDGEVVIFKLTVYR